MQNELHKVPEDKEAFLKNQIKALSGDVWGLIHTSDRVFFCRENAESELSAKLKGLTRLQELRLFNEKGECHIWRWNGELYYRIRGADAGAGLNIYSQDYVLWGTDCDANEDGSFTLREEGQGCRFGFPLRVEKKQLPLKLTVHNYYKFDEDGLLHFVDACLVGLKSCNGGEL